MKKQKPNFWEEESSKKEDDTRSGADKSIDNSISMLREVRQMVRFAKAIEEVGVPLSNVLGPKRSAVYGQVLGIWLRKGDYATKQRGQPSDYRKFPKPITLSERAEKRFFNT